MEVNMRKMAWIMSLALIGSAGCSLLFVFWFRAWKRQSGLFPAKTGVVQEEKDPNLGELRAWLTKKVKTLEDEWVECWDRMRHLQNRLCQRDRRSRGGGGVQDEGSPLPEISPQPPLQDDPRAAVMAEFMARRNAGG